MVTLIENFLVRNGNQFRIDASLPLRIQKRQLLKSLGFPGNTALTACLASDSKQVRGLFKKYSAKSFPFLILVSEKPSRTSVPPLFLVNAKDKITWRNDNNQKTTISYPETLRLISRYRPTTWLEFSDYIWGKDTLAGRLMFINSTEQIIELQIGVVPGQLLLLNQRNLPVYSGSLRWLELQANDHQEDTTKLKNIGHKNILSYISVCGVAKKLRGHFGGFQKLARVAPFPTLEFGITKGQALICIDVDWPSQWKEV